jgi:hypothetical protein
VVTNSCAFYTAHEAAGAFCAPPSLRPPAFEGDAEAKPGRDRAAGMRSHILALFDIMNRKEQLVRHCEPTVRTERGPVTGSAKQSVLGRAPRCLLPTMPSFATQSLAEQQVTCTYAGRYRELCPHIIETNKSGEETVLAWQFAGESTGPLPQWRCLRLANVSNARARNGRWYAGGSHKTTQQCVTKIELDINVHVRKLR